MAKLTYNIITLEASWDCPNCQHINSFNVKKKLATIECEKCKSRFPLDPLRYAQFERMDKVCGDALIEILSGEKMNESGNEATLIQDE